MFRDYESPENYPWGTSPDDYPYMPILNERAGNINSDPIVRNYGQDYMYRDTQPPGSRTKYPPYNYNPINHDTSNYIYERMENPDPGVTSDPMPQSIRGPPGPPLPSDFIFIPKMRKHDDQGIWFLLLVICLLCFIIVRQQKTEKRLIKMIYSMRNESVK